MLTDAFSSINWYDLDRFLLEPVMMNYVDDIWILWQPYIPRINLIWPWCKFNFIYYWVLFVNILLRIFVFISMTYASV